MPRRVAFLRSINVGRRRVKMDILRGAFERLGLRNAATHLASGNVVFDGNRKLEKKLERHLEAVLGFEVPCFVRDLSDLPDALAACPFDVPEGRHCYVGFAMAPVDPAPLGALEHSGDRLGVAGAEVYWLVPTKMSESALEPKGIEKAIGQPLTFRKMSSLEKLLAKHG